MKIGYFTIVLILLVGCAQNAPRNEDPSAEKIEAIKQLIGSARDSTGLPLEERRQFLHKAQEITFALPNDSLLLTNLSNISLAYRDLPDSIAFRKTNAQVLLMSKETELYTTLGYSHWDLATFFKNNGVLDSSFYHYQKAMNSFELLPVDPNSRSLKAKMLYSMGKIQDSYKDYLGAETSITEALRIFTDLEDTKRIYNCYNVLGIIASGMGNSDKSLEYFQKARSYIDDMESMDRIKYTEQTQNNIAHEFLKKEDYGRAKVAFGELLQNEGIFARNPELYSLSLSSRAYSLYKDENDLEKSKKLLQQAIRINDSIDYPFEQARVKKYYAEILADQGDTANAITYAKESRGLAKQTYNNEGLMEVLRLLTKLDSNNAAAYSNEYYDLNETIKAEERTKRDKFARIRMETDEIAQENVVLTRQSQIWAGISVLTVIFLLGGYIISVQKISNDRLKSEEKQQKLNQKVYDLMLQQQGKFQEGKQLEQKRISEELHDGVLGEMLGIRLILSALNNKDDEASVRKRSDFLERLQHVEEDIRTISHELNDAAYKKFHNFILSVETLLSETEDSSMAKCSLTYSSEVNWDRLWMEIKINVIRIIQESLKNSTTHGHSENIKVNFDVQGEKLKVTIADDGIGFDVDKGKKGIGLKNIASRVEKIKGTLTVDSTKNVGTTIVVTIPCKYEKLAAAPNTDDEDFEQQVINA
ncbi:MAG: ATP-binding protein [Flavobacteriaceae bacterium]|uniref:tetratricopeptide repeat-containing sensor histidine kinase n=1 Tax=Flagellimonas sp. SN16 TaxID=3415142 RepID=UPI003C657C44|nr:ATP-binding protein [Flavobacteriaceae bacterium]